MKISFMQNTTIFCLKCLAASGWLTAREIALARWPSSQQTAKKEATVRQHLDVLKKHGFAFEITGYFEITDAGREAAKVASQRVRPIMLGLAG